MIPQSIIDRGIRDKRHTLNILVIIKSKEELNLKAMRSFSETLPWLPKRFSHEYRTRFLCTEVVVQQSTQPFIRTKNDIGSDGTLS
jgi:hypothetical protein